MEATVKEKTKEALKELLKYIGIPLLLVILFCTYDDGTDFSAEDVWQAEEKAREEGYNAGYEDGYDKGYEKGHEDGYYAGYNDK